MLFRPFPGGTEKRHFQAIGSTSGTGGQGLDAEKVRTPLVPEPSTPCQQIVLSLHSGDHFLQDSSGDWLQTSLISLALV